MDVTSTAEVAGRHGRLRAVLDDKIAVNERPAENPYPFLLIIISFTYI